MREHLCARPNHSKQGKGVTWRQYVFLCGWCPTASASHCLTAHRMTQSMSRASLKAVLWCKMLAINQCSAADVHISAPPEYVCCPGN